MNEVIDQIKSHLPIVQVAVDNGLKLHYKGKRIFVSCVFHAGDNEASMELFTDQNSGYCHACKQKFDSIDLWANINDYSNTEAIKILKKEFNINDNQQVKHTPKTVASYDYKLEDGSLSYQVLRKEPKGFVQRRPDGKGKWIYNLKDTEPIPYKLPELLKAIGAGDTVFICEGEKDIDNLTKLGLVGTCNNSGAGKWTVKHSKYFPAGCEVVVLPDNDIPGQDHGKEVAKQLQSRGCKVKVVNLPRLPPKGDLSDWLLLDNSKDELLEIVANTGYTADSKSDKEANNDKFPFFNGKKFIILNVAEWLKREHNIINVSGELYVYKNGVYKEAEDYLRREVTMALGKETTPKRVSDSLTTLKDILETTSTSDLGFPKGTINLKNGWLNLDTLELIKHTPTIKTIYQIPTNYNPMADTTAFDKFIDMVNPECREAIEETIGYCLMDTMKYEKAIMFYAPNGKNGKGSLLALISKMLGKENVSNKSLQSLANDKFSSSTLYGKLANLYADLPGGLINDTDMFNMLVSGDVLSGEQKFKDSFSFNNKAKMIFSSNHLPSCKQVTAAFLRRWLMIPFTRIFEGGKFRDELFEQGNIEGMLIRAIEGIKRLRDNNGFTITENMTELLNQYQIIVDPCAEYFAEQVEQKVDAYIGKQDLYDDYKYWCSDQGKQHISQTKFNMRVKEYFITDEIRLGQYNTRSWCDLKLVPGKRSQCLHLA